ncbi:amino acid adenylation domain-containing protein [uncultured Kordia sp.]|uniref:non-ribosomal peptide synthetase n=1 Tax=uncultured Kordia sp. TaxID=507699 RepID=UPI002614154B|nr:amino acid adenylation domain-containing protein [uncultured Kordia sp.]
MIDFLKELKKQHISIAVEGDELLVSFQTDEIDPTTVQNIRENKQELITFLKKYTVGKDKNAIPKTQAQESYPISDAQRRLWVLCQFEEGLRAYNMPMQIHLEGEYDFKILIQSIGALIERHEILRTNFRENHTGEIRQWIKPIDKIELPFDFEDVRGHKDSEAYMDEYIKKDSYVPFDIEYGMLFRGRVFQVTDYSFQICLNMHHIIGDAWSEVIFMKELAVLYKDLVFGQENSLEPLKIQYKDYTTWQLNQINKGVWKKQENYWLEHLSGKLPILDLPTNQIRPAVRSSTGRTIKAFIPTEITSKLRAFGLDNKGSLFTSIFCIWYLTFHKYTNDKDIIIASPLAGRLHQGLEDQLGFYASMIAMRNKIDVEETFLDFYKRTTDILLSSFENQMYPFDRLIESLDMVRDTSRNPVYDVMISLLNAGVGHKTRNDNYEEIVKEFTIEDKGECMSKWDMEIVYRELDGFLFYDFIFNPDVYEQELIESVIRHYHEIMISVINNPHQKIKDIDFLLPAEREELLEFNTNHVEETKLKGFSTILEAFQEQVNIRPEATALVSGESLSYAEVAALSNQFANYLRSNYSIEENTMIAMQLPRNNWMVIIILGIMKSGAAYIPMALDLPKKRSEYILENSGCSLCIDVTELNVFIENQSKYSEKAPEITISAEQLAYTIYTSGTTGTPKGVMLKHENLLSFLRNFETNFQFENVDKIGATTNYTFDISILELLGGLAYGKSISVFTDDEIADPHLLLERIENDQLDFLQLTPSRLRQLTEISPVLPKSLKTLMLGGELLPQSLFDKLCEHNDLHIIHVYGPTETTIWSTSNVQKKGSRVVLGKPLFNEEVYILSENLKLVPRGVVGEICIAGEGLAKGYINDEEKTNDKFIDNPFKKGTKMYRTGDLGKWTRNNELEFIGRKDSQLKLRGYRIELKEIERLLMNHSLVDEAIVVAVENARNDDKQLVAYVVLTNEAEELDLKSYLKEYLPSYMIPVLFSAIDKMPLNANGKIDRVQLAKATVEVKNAVYEAPRNEIEKSIAQIWEKTLNIENIGISDNFFSLGGNSINMIRVKKEMKKELKIEMTFAEMFHYITIKEISDFVKSK